MNTSETRAAHLEPLVENGVLEEIICGWMAINPQPEAGSRVDDACGELLDQNMVSRIQQMNEQIGGAGLLLSYCGLRSCLHRQKPPPSPRRP